MVGQTRQQGGLSQGRKRLEPEAFEPFWWGQSIPSILARLRGSGATGLSEETTLLRCCCQAGLVSRLAFWLKTILASSQLGAGLTFSCIWHSAACKAIGSQRDRLFTLRVDRHRCVSLCGETHFGQRFGTFSVFAVGGCRRGRRVLPVCRVRDGGLGAIRLKPGWRLSH